MSTRYVIAGGEAGWRRLNLLARTMAPTTRAHLVAAGVSDGMACIDVGCGGGHVTLMLAEMVGPSGRVLGIDFDRVKLAAARAEAEGKGLRNVEFKEPTCSSGANHPRTTSFSGASSCRTCRVASA